MQGGFIRIQHRGHAGLAALEQIDPVLTVLAGEGAGQSSGQLAPAAAIILAGGEFGEAQPGDHHGIELRLYRPDRDLAPIGAQIAAVIRHRPREKVFRPVQRNAAEGLQPGEEAHQRGHTVDDGGIHHLPLAGTLPLPQGGENAENKEHRAAAEIAHEVERQRGRLARAAHCGQRAAQRNIGDIVPGKLRQWAILTPAGDPGEDQAGILPAQHIGPKPQPFHHPGAKPLNDDIGHGCGAQAKGAACCGAYINSGGGAAAIGDGVGPAIATLPVDPQHIGAQIGQQHRRMGPRPDTGEFNHPQARKGPAHR